MPSCHAAEFRGGLLIRLHLQRWHFLTNLQADTLSEVKEAEEGLGERKEGASQRWEAWDVSSQFLFSWPQKASSR